MAMVVPPEQVKNKVESHRYQLKQVTPHIGSKVDSTCIDSLCKVLFNNRTSHNKASLIESLNSLQDNKI